MFLCIGRNVFFFQKHRLFTVRWRYSCFCVAFCWLFFVIMVLIGMLAIDLQKNFVKKCPVFGFLGHFLEFSQKLQFSDKSGYFYEKQIYFCKKLLRSITSFMTSNIGISMHPSHSGINLSTSVCYYTYILLLYWRKFIYNHIALICL